MVRVVGIGDAVVVGDVENRIAEAGVVNCSVDVVSGVADGVFAGDVDGC